MGPGGLPPARELSPLGGLPVSLTPSPADPVASACSARCPISEPPSAPQPGLPGTPTMVGGSSGLAEASAMEAAAAAGGQAVAPAGERQTQGVVGKVDMPRCAASLQLMGCPAAGALCWHCPACKRGCVQGVCLGCVCM